MCRVEGVAHPENPAESVVALLAALGSRIVEGLAAKTLIRGGLKEEKPANVSPMPITEMNAKLWLLRIFVFVHLATRTHTHTHTHAHTHTHTHTHQQQP